MTELPKAIFTKILTYIDYREHRRVATDFVENIMEDYHKYDDGGGWGICLTDEDRYRLDMNWQEYLKSGLPTYEEWEKLNNQQRCRWS